jgi:hypothetical protein
MEQEQKKTLSILKESFFMYEKSIKEAQERLSEAMLPDGSKKFTQEQIDIKIGQIREMQNDVKEKYLTLGGNPDELSISKETTKTTKTRPAIKKEKVTKPKTESKRKPIVKPKKENDSAEVVKNTIKQEEVATSTQTSVFVSDFNNIDFYPF